MRMKQTGIFVLILVELAGTQASADGKFFVREKVPPDIPYQRAFLLFDDGTETLFVQSRYGVSTSGPGETLGWVVPVPGVPELASAEADDASLFFEGISYYIQPHERHLSSHLLVLAGVIVLAGLVLLLLCPVWRSSAKSRRRLRFAGYGMLLFGFLLGLATGLGALVEKKSEIAVEIIKSEQVGIYDVKVIRGDSAEAVTTWLEENEFAFGEEDVSAFRDYVARGWCFVTAKIRPGLETDTTSVSFEGLAAPLVLTFDVNEPVYPLALTATAGTETEILLYTLTGAKLTCNDRLKLRHAAQMNSRRITDELLVRTGTDETQPMAGLPDKPMMLCKFKGTMTAEQMREDLVFEPAPDNAPYRETIWTW